MKIRPYMYILSGTMFGQINHDGFFGFFVQKMGPKHLKKSIKAHFGLVWFGNVLVVILDQFWYS